METTTDSFFSESKQKVKEYFEDRILLLRLNGIHKSSKLISLFFVVMLVLAIVFFITFFLSIMAGYYFASLTGSMYAGFGIVAALYLILLIIIIAIRKKVIEKIVTNTLINIFFDKNDEDDEA